MIAVLPKKNRHCRLTAKRSQTRRKPERFWFTLSWFESIRGSQLRIRHLRSFIKNVGKTSWLELNLGIFSGLIVKPQLTQLDGRTRIRKYRQMVPASTQSNCIRAGLEHTPAPNGSAWTESSKSTRPAIRELVGVLCRLWAVLWGIGLCCPNSNDRSNA